MKAFQNKPFKHIQDIQIRFNDLDILGHVNNAIYQNYYDVARLNYFNEVFRERPNWKEKSLVLAEVRIQFIKPILMYDNICVRTKIYELGNKSLKMHQDIYDLEKKEIKSENNAVLVGFDLKRNETIPLLNSWRIDVTQYEGI